jgi:hypothetical protein
MSARFVLRRIKRVPEVMSLIRDSSSNASRIFI